MLNQNSLDIIAYSESELKGRLHEISETFLDLVLGGSLLVSKFYMRSSYILFHHVNICNLYNL